MKTVFKNWFRGAFAALTIVAMMSFSLQTGDSGKYISALGKSSDSPEFTNLKSTGIFEEVNNQHYLSKDGIELILQQNTLNQINFYRSSEVYGKFTGDLPKGLKFGMTPAQVKSILGKPTVAYNSSGYLEFTIQQYTYACSFDKGVLSQVGISVK